MWETLYILAHPGLRLEIRALILPPPFPPRPMWVEYPIKITVITRCDGYPAVMEPHPLWFPKNISQDCFQIFKIGAVVLGK